MRERVETTWKDKEALNSLLSCPNGLGHSLDELRAPVHTPPSEVQWHYLLGCLGGTCGHIASGDIYLLAKGAVLIDRLVAGLLQPLLCHPQEGRGMRLILDLTHMNGHHCSLWTYCLEVVRLPQTGGFITKWSG